MIEIDRDHGIGDIGQNTFQAAIGGVLDRAIDFLNSGGSFGDEGQVNHRYIWRRHPNGRPVELARQFRQHQSNRTGRAGGGWDHAQAAGPGAPRITMQGI